MLPKKHNQIPSPIIRNFVKERKSNEFIGNFLPFNMNYIWFEDRFEDIDIIWTNQFNDFKQL